MKYQITDKAGNKLAVVEAKSPKESLEKAKEIEMSDDIHADTARKIFGLGPDDEVSEEDRAKAKAVNFGVIYGSLYGGEPSKAKEIEMVVNNQPLTKADARRIVYNPRWSWQESTYNERNCMYKTDEGHQCERSPDKGFHCWQHDRIIKNAMKKGR